MQVQPSDRRKLIKFFPAGLLRLRAARLMLLGIGGLSVAIATTLFWQPLNLLEVPQVSHPSFLLAPTVVLLIVAQVVMKVSPEPRTWSKLLVVSMLLALALRYVLWRSSTLNLTDPLNGIFSLGLFLAELLFIFSNSLQLYLMLKAKPRHREADRHSIAVLQGKYSPTVDILIPTYNEPEFILRRTIIGCQALQYSSKTIYLLDDKRRPEMRFLAQELGCEYITRADNRQG